MAGSIPDLWKRDAEGGRVPDVELKKNKQKKQNTKETKAKKQGRKCENARVCFYGRKEVNSAGE